MDNNQGNNQGNRHGSNTHDNTHKLVIVVASVDWHYTQWTAKPVAFVSYGGAAGVRHAVLHLENVLTELHAVTIRDGLAFPNYFTAWQDGRPNDPEAAQYAKTLLEQLAWWTGALRTARAATPYPA